MNYLLATTSKFILCINPADNVVKVVEAYRGIYYGAFRDELSGRLFVATRNSHRGFIDPEARAAERGSILVYDADLTLVDEIHPPIPMRDLHAMIYDEGSLYVVCSFDNRVVVGDLAAGTWEAWYPHPDPSRRDRDVNHFNTITRIGDALYLVAHNWGPSEVLTFDRRTRDLLGCQSIGREAHDVWMEAGDLCVLSSGEGLVRSTERALQRTNAYPRGHCSIGGRRFVGLSGRGASSERLDDDGVVRVYAQDWSPLRDIALRSIGMINQFIPVVVSDAAFDALPALASRPLKPGAAERFDPALYVFGETRGILDRYPQEWHATESEGCWTAAREARVRIVVAPGSRSLTITFTTIRPARTYVCVAGVRIGAYDIAEATRQIATYPLPPGLCGEQVVTIGTDALGRVPEDPRSLGVFVYRLRLD